MPEDLFEKAFQLRSAVVKFVKERQAEAVNPGDLVTLDGSGSSDADGPVPLTFSWIQLPTGAPNVILSNPTASSTTFTAPDIPHPEFRGASFSGGCWGAACPSRGPRPEKPDRAPGKTAIRRR